MTKISLRRVAAAGTLALLVGAGLVGFDSFRSKTDEKPSYLTAVVERKDVSESVLATGTLKALKQVSVGAQVSGQIKSLRVALGDQVTKGQVIAEIDSLTQQNSLKQAEAQLKDVTAQRAGKVATLKQAQLAFQRQKVLLKQDASSKENYESAEATLAVTQAEIAALDAQIQEATVSTDTAKVNLGYTTITAPMDGTVVYVAVKEGQTVNAAQTTPTIIKLAELDTMTVEAEISEADVVKVSPGMPVSFTILGEPDHLYAATLRQIKPAPDSISEEDTTGTTSTSSTSSSSSSSAVYYNGLFDVPNPDGKLRISMTAEVTIKLAEAKAALVIPLSAIGGAKNGKASVQVLGTDGTVATRTIDIGIADGALIEVKNGLAEGERVILREAAETDTANRGAPPMGF
jgi:macrolide-specific efflux system membrane fusion protein